MTNGGGFYSTLLKLVDITQLIPIAITGLSIAGLIISGTTLEVHPIFEYLIEKWQEVLFIVSIVIFDPLLWVIKKLLINIFNFKISFIDYYREVFVILSFYCFNSIKISVQRKRYGNAIYSLIILLSLSIISSLNTESVWFGKNSFALAMFSFFIYDLLQAIYDSKYYSPPHQTKYKTFVWYFMVQVVWSLMFAVICHTIANSLLNIGVVGGDLIAYIVIVALLSIRNLMVGTYFVMINRESGQPFLDCFKTSFTAKMGIYLMSTLLFAANYILLGAGFNLAKYLWQ